MVNTNRAKHTTRNVQDMMARISASSISCKDDEIVEVALLETTVLCDIALSAASIADSLRRWQKQ